MFCHLQEKLDVLVYPKKDLELKFKDIWQILSTNIEHIMSLHANRKFYDIPSETAEEIDIRTDLPDRKELLSLVCQSVIGKDKTFSGPFGLRKGQHYFVIESIS